MWWIIGGIAVIYLSYAIFPTLYFKANAIPYNKTEKDKYICLTFDDGPDEHYTNQLLDLLQMNGVKATFFVVAEFAEKNPQIIARMKMEGHCIGLHSLEHKNALLKGCSYTNKDFKEAQKKMKSLNVNIKYFRPPWGHVNLATLLNISKYNLNLVLWDVIIGDWKSNITPKEIANRLMAQTKNTNIVCLHDGRGEKEAPSRTIAALETVLPVWKKQGYQFLKVEQLYE